MTARQTFAGAGVNILLAILSGLLAGLTFPPFEWWPLAWVALVPLLIAMHRTSAVRASGYLAIVFGLALCAVALHWMTDIFGGAIIGIFVLVALPWYLFGVGYRALIGRSPLPVILAMTPALWLAAEWIRCEGWYFRFSWLQWGFTQVPSPLQAAYPLIGVYGVTALIVLCNAALALALVRRGRQSAVAAALVVLGIGVLFGWLPARPPAPAPAERAALIVQNESGNLDDLLRLTRPTMTPETELVVWPEYAEPGYLLDDEMMKRDLQQLQAFAAEHGCTLVLGTKERAPSDAPCDWLRRRGMMLEEGKLFYNIALVLGPDGALLGRYAKTHPIQFFSDGVPGRSFDPIDTPAGRMGIAICYDFDYARTALRLVRNGAELLVVPTYDKITWGPVQHRQHTRMAEARTAEVGRYTLRATSSGISQILDPGGRALAAIPTGEQAAAAGGYQPLQRITPYVRLAWRLPYLCLMLGLLWAVWVAGSVLVSWRNRSRDSAGAAV